MSTRVQPTDPPPKRLTLKLVQPDERQHHETWEAALVSHFTTIPNGLLSGDLGLTNDELVVLLVLTRWVHGQGAGSVTINRRGGIRILNLAKWANQSRSQALRSLSTLEHRRFVTIDRRDGVPSTYTLHLDHIARHLRLPPTTADPPAPETTPAVNPGLKPNVYAGRCKQCGVKINAGEGVMNNGLRHIDCGVPNKEPVTRKGWLFGKPPQDWRDPSRRQR